MVRYRSNQYRLAELRNRRSLWYSKLRRRSWPRRWIVYRFQDSKIKVTLRLSRIKILCACFQRISNRLLKTLGSMFSSCFILLNRRKFFSPGSTLPPSSKEERSSSQLSIEHSGSQECHQKICRRLKASRRASPTSFYFPRMTRKASGTISRTQKRCWAFSFSKN